jgi:hypothetical protein
VKSPSADTGGWPPLAWFDAHELFVLDPATGRSTNLAGVTGVSVPTWSHDGKTLLYVSDDALWLVPAKGGHAAEVVSPLFLPSLWRDVGSSDLLSYYGQVDWTGQFDWWSS